MLSDDEVRTRIVNAALEVINDLAEWDRVSFEGVMAVLRVPASPESGS